MTLAILPPRPTRCWCGWGWHPWSPGRPRYKRAWARKRCSPLDFGRPISPHQRPLCRCRSGARRLRALPDRRPQRAGGVVHRIDHRIRQGLGLAGLLGVSDRAGADGLETAGGGAGVVATGAGAGIGFCTGAVDNSAQPASTRGAKKILSYSKPRSSRGVHPATGSSLTRPAKGRALCPCWNLPIGLLWQRDHGAARGDPAGRSRMSARVVSIGSAKAQAPAPLHPKGGLANA